MPSIVGEPATAVWMYQMADKEAVNVLLNKGVQLFLTPCKIHT